MLIIEDCRVYGNSLYYLLNFCVNLKLLQFFFIKGRMPQSLPLFPHFAELAFICCEVTLATFLLSSPALACFSETFQKILSKG